MIQRKPITFDFLKSYNRAIKKNIYPGSAHLALSKNIFQIFMIF